jgi:hypothetical protein
MRETSLETSQSLTSEQKRARSKPCGHSRQEYQYIAINRIAFQVTFQSCSVNLSFSN